MNDPRQLWLMQLRLECKQLDQDGRLVRAPGDNPDEIPVCAVTRFAGRYEWAFSRAAGLALIEECKRFRPEEWFGGSTSVNDLLAASGLQIQRCSTYHFANPLPDPTGATAEIVRNGPESFATAVGGLEVAWATSVRSNSECAELWVRTDPDHRRRGYAGQAAAAWAAAVTAGGRVAFYSHLAENEPSRRLARRLGVRHLFDLAALSPPESPR